MAVESQASPESRGRRRQLRRLRLLRQGVPEGRHLHPPGL